jgi:hypothetical protein
VIHVYAFADELRGLPELDGVDGAPLERREVDGFEAVLSRRTRRTDDGSLQTDALAHGGVVEALVELAAAVLPVRFGEGADDERELVQTVGERSPELRRALGRVRGCVEVGLRVAGSEQPRLAPAATGAAYMRALRTAEEERRDTIGALHDELAVLSREARIEAPAPAGAFAAAYLVERDGVPAVRGRAARFAAAHPQLAVLCTGPWAPYSFVGEAA